MAEKRKDNKGRILRQGELQKKDGRYEFRYTDTKGIRQSVYSWKLTEGDAVPKGKRACVSLRQMENEILKNQLDGVAAKCKTSLNDRWDEYIANKPELKQSTRTNYKYMYKKYVRDDIGTMAMDSIKYSTMKMFFNKLLHENGFKPNSVEIINTMLHPVFTIAVRDGLIRINPTDGIMADLKRSNSWEKPKRHALTRTQQLCFVEFVENHPVYKRWYPLITCLLGTGCRIAEMLGLRWEDVFWKEETISINHNLIYRLQDDDSVQYRITTTKTKNGTRKIPMFNKVKTVLQQEYVLQSKNGFCQQEIEGYSGFIWMNRYGKVLSPVSVNRALSRIIRDYNKVETQKAVKEHRDPDLLPHFSAHNLRHTFCTRLCEEESDLKLIQEIMGHADITTTMDIYNESSLERKKERFAKLEKLSQVF